MLLNEHVALSTKSVLLVPYSDHHVPFYHEWMQDPELQQTTASEPLSLPEEYDMQKSWRTDVDKLTFIVCTPLETSTAMLCGHAPLPPSKYDNPSTMLGDVNLFLSRDDNDEGVDDGQPQQCHRIIGELELMVANRAQRGRGFGRSALVAFLRYVIDHQSTILNTFAEGEARSKFASHLTQAIEDPSGAIPSSHLSFLRARIGATNIRSIALFTKLGFEKVNEEPNYFGEIELRRYDLSKEWVDGLFETYVGGSYSELKYTEELDN